MEQFHTPTTTRWSSWCDRFTVYQSPRGKPNGIILDHPWGLSYAGLLMATSESNGSKPAKQSFDGISCAGILLVGLIALGIIIISSGNRVVSGTNHAGGPTTQIKVNGALSASSSIAEGRPVAAIEAEPEGATQPRPTLPPDRAVSEASEPVAGSVDSAQRTATTTPDSSTDASSSEPLPTPVGVYSLTVKVPVLMYHHISQPPEGADIYRQDLSVSPEAFRAQMQFLIDKGYTAVSLEDLSLAVVGKRALPSRPVVITVDDGYRDNYENAFPILRELGLQATFFIATDFVDRNNQEYMSWAMIEEMAAAGMRFEPHSKSHVDLPGRSRAFLIWEILGSRDTLQAHLGRQPRYFAYPSGRYDDAAVQIVQELGFWGAVTTQDGRWHGYNDRFLWKRVRMRYTTTLEMLPALLNGQAE